MIEFVIAGTVVVATGVVGLIAQRVNKPLKQTVEVEEVKKSPPASGPYRMVPEGLEPLNEGEADPYEDEEAEAEEEELHGLSADEARAQVQEIEDDTRARAEEIKADLWDKHVAKELRKAIKGCKHEAAIHGASGAENGVLMDHAHNLGYKTKFAHSKEWFYLYWPKPKAKPDRI